jgi:hypothetical protein
VTSLKLLLLTRRSRGPRVQSKFENSVNIMASAFALRRIAPAIAFNVPKRLFHPLSGQSMQEIQEKWSTPPSANLVPIVIEQTVKVLSIWLLFVLNVLLHRVEGSAHMIYFRVFFASVLSCFMVLWVSKTD